MVNESLSLLNGYNWEYTLFSDKPICIKRANSSKPMTILHPSAARMSHGRTELPTTTCARGGIATTSLYRPGETASPAWPPEAGPPRGGFHGVPPIAGWFRMGILLKMDDDWEYPHKNGNPHVWINIIINLQMVSHWVIDENWLTSGKYTSLGLVKSWDERTTMIGREYFVANLPVFMFMYPLVIQRSHGKRRKTPWKSMKFTSK
jgi:hypothetical protein